MGFILWLIAGGLTGAGTVNQGDFSLRGLFVPRVGAVNLLAGILPFTSP